MLKVNVEGFDDLSDEEQNNAASNGYGKESALYLRVTQDGETILLESDAMEPEDASFGRDLSWIADIIEKAYEIGKVEAA